MSFEHILSILRLLGDILNFLKHKPHGFSFFLATIKQYFGKSSKYLRSFSYNATELIYVLCSCSMRDNKKKTNL